MGAGQLTGCGNLQSYLLAVRTRSQKTVEDPLLRFPNSRHQAKVPPDSMPLAQLEQSPPATGENSGRVRQSDTGDRTLGESLNPGGI